MGQPRVTDQCQLFHGSATCKLDVC